MPAKGPTEGSIFKIDLHRAELLDLLQLVAEIFEREAVAEESFLGELLGLLAVERGFGLLDERKHVAHAEDAADDAVGMKRLEGVGLFAHADELDGLAGDVADGERRAAAGVAVHLGEDHAGESETSMKVLRGVDGVLAGHGVGDEEDLLRAEELFEALHLGHQIFVDVEAAGGVDDERVAAHDDGFAAGFFGKALNKRGAGGLALLVAFVEARLDLLGDDFELLARGGAVDVDRDEHGTVTALLEPGGQLAGGGGFAGALQAGHENDRGRLGGEVEARGVFAEQGDELVADDLDDLLGGRERGEDFSADGLLRGCAR